MKTNTDPPPLDRWRFDQITRGSERIWGLTAIAAVLGVSRDAARTMAKNPEVPIYRPAGQRRWFALRSELLAWLRTKP